MRTQYQTSLGLGKPFPRDTAPGQENEPEGLVTVPGREAVLIIETKDFRGTRWDHPASTGSVLEEEVETTAGTISRHLVVSSLSQSPHVGVAYVSIIMLEIVYVDARANSRTMIVKEVTDVQEVYYL